MKPLQFYDVKTKKRFITNNYKYVTKKNRKFAVTQSPSGIQCWRIVGKA